MSTVIKVENLSKQYRLGQVGTGSLAHDINRKWHKLTGRQDPYLKVGEVNDRTVKGNADYVWALRNVDFSIAHGDVVGIIGKNGAGKSTLLKILSKTTAPTTGSVAIKGRMASLLEVGTGFHPELSGRDNIFLNGSILGMRRAEIKSRFDEIVDFAGVERYIDTPVKRYSSGMYVRLAFAVAAHLQSEILIVDEVLAVGDQEFQTKCIGKMKDVSSRDGKTVIFVSHSMASIKSLCTSAFLMEKGTVINSGSVQDMVKEYLGGFSNTNTGDDIPDNVRAIKSAALRTEKISFTNSQSEPTTTYYFGEPIRITAEVDFFADHMNLMMDVTLMNINGDPVSYSYPTEVFSFAIGRHVIEVNIDNHFLPGEYLVNFGIHTGTGATLEYLQSFRKITVQKTAAENTLDYPYDWIHGHIHLASRWKVNNQK